MQILPSWRDLLIEQAKTRIIVENIARIDKCLNMLTLDQVWHRIHSQTNPIGNLILHLEGNARQWILSSFSNAPDHRIRQQEFDQTEKTAIEDLKQRLQKLASDLNECFDSITEQALLDNYEVQCFREAGIGIIVHVIEHFSYHTGQIAYLTKWMTEKDTDFYGDEPLDQTKS